MTAAVTATIAVMYTARAQPVVLSVPLSKPCSTARGQLA
jgi:hypothetical protein